MKVYYSNCLTTILYYTIFLMLLFVVLLTSGIVIQATIYWLSGKKISIYNIIVKKINTFLANL